jgi:hypothetical protein
LTDDGVTGWGEAFAQGLEPPEIAAVTIDKALRPLIVGANPLDTEVLWHRMYHTTRDYGRKGSVVAAISAVDIALWDIAGKVRGEPIHALLGGAFRTRVQPYATGFYRIRGQGEAQRLAEEALRHFEAGFTLMKVKLGYGVDDDIASMEEIARAIQGKPVRLMVDTNHAYGRAEALRLGRALDEYDLRWYEEPVVPEDLRGYAELRSKLATPIAGGENEHTLYGFRELAGRECGRHRAARRRVVRRHHRHAPHRSTRAVARRAGESARVGIGHRAGGFAAGDRRAARRAPFDPRAGADPRIRSLVASVPRAARRRAGAPGRGVGGGADTSGTRRGGRSGRRSIATGFTRRRVLY